MWQVYLITNIANNKVYIGISKDVEKRWKKHLQISNNTKSKHNYAIHKAIKKYGQENFSLIILKSLETLNEAKLSEINYISKYKSNIKNFGYNLTIGGEGVSKPMSEQTKKKISLANTGKIRTQETKNKISISNKGKKRTTEAILNYSKAKKGNILSEETKNKISKKIKELWLNDDYKNRIIESNTGKVYSIESRLKKSGENSKLSKLSVKQVKEIFEKYSTGNYSHRSLGKEYGVSYRQIGYILSGESWKLTMENENAKESTCN
jgi:group I intron endonuclease